MFLGPRVKPEHAMQVCDVLDRRPVEVLQGQTKGFELTFRSIKPARPLNECERVGAGRFDPAEDLGAEKELRDFLTVPFDALVEECRRTALRPNMEDFTTIHVTGSTKSAMYIGTTYKLRSGRKVYHKCYFDQHVHPLPSAPI